MPPTLPLSSAPKTLCLLRLSAIGDITHMLPIVRTLQQYWPSTKITWVIGRVEHQLVGDIEGIEFITFDKAKGWRAYQHLYTQLKRRSFDVLLHMQVSMRASIASLLIKSPIKLGFDKKRAKDYQWLFTNARIPAVERQHVVDGLFQFLSTLGLSEQVLRWDIPLSASDRQWATEKVEEKAGGRIERIEGRGDRQPLIIINPSSSQRLNNWRNWSADNYAEVIQYAAVRYGAQVMLTGGPADNEKQLARAILDKVANDRPDLLSSISNWVGKTSLKQLAALMTQATAVIAPDTGPAHIANAVRTPVIGLYVTSNPQRTGPYQSQEFVVNAYPDALLTYEGIGESTAPWGKRVRHPEALALITAEDVKEKIDLVMERRSI